MRLLDVRAVLDREKDIHGVDPEIEVLKELDDNRTSYAILSHRWGTEVTYDEMTGLVAMGTRKRDKIRQRDGYQKIIKSCEQANKDGYSWLWIDTCCIDKKSSAELSEAINSMYRWYRNSQMCYVYLNDVDDSAFPIEPDFGKFCRSSGWPEWFSRGWTLQELIAPRELEFFNKSWVPIGNKQDLTSTLEGIARIPEKVLRNEQVLRSWERPSVAQIMSWAADRRTTRMEDRAYSLMGLFGVNMPMLYGEGLKAFQRLQLEIIRTASSDCSILAWNLKGRFGLHKSVLADDPSCFRGCHDIAKVDPRWFVNELKVYLHQNRLGVDANRVELESLLRDVCSPLLSKFDVSNLGIQVSLPVVPIDHGYSDSYLTAVLPCRDRYGDLITIDLEPHESTTGRCLGAARNIPNTLPQFTSLYLECSQDAEESYHDLMVHDGRTSYYGFTRCGTFPWELAGDVVTFSSQGNNFIVLVYANNDTKSRFAVGLGYYFGKVSARVFCDEGPANQECWSSWSDFAKQAYDILWNAPIQEPYSLFIGNTVTDTHLPRSIWDARIFSHVGDGGSSTDVMIDIEQCPGCCTGPRAYNYVGTLAHELWLPWTSQPIFSYELELGGRSAWIPLRSVEEMGIAVSRNLSPWACGEPHKNSWAIIVANIPFSNVAGTYSKICGNLVSTPRIHFIAQSSLVYPVVNVGRVACRFSMTLPCHATPSKIWSCINPRVSRFRTTKHSSCC
ncbi:heterokaryon incompatibility protein-domain-containing protein [Pisolithus tinctorius]|nr:heterokaryon incompatibility protein-domain-containing protein [Pisolithus tinctorius]